MVPTNYYYRPEVDVFLREYLLRMESQEVFCDTQLETAWHTMADLRAAHVTLVNEVSDEMQFSQDVHPFTPVSFPIASSSVLKSKRIRLLPLCA